MFLRGNSLYRLVDGPTWSHAEESAQALGGHLVSINDLQEQIFLSDNLPNLNLWIGYSDSQNEGTWEWVNGDKSTYTNWHPEAIAGFSNNTQYTIEKSNGLYTEGEDYAFMYANTRLWDDGVGRHDHGEWLKNGIAEIPIYNVVIQPM